MNYNKIRCEVCKIEIHRASYARHFKSKKFLEKITKHVVKIL